MKKTQVLSLISETGKRVQEEKYGDISVQYHTEFSLNEKPTRVVYIYRKADGANFSGNYSKDGGLAINNFDASLIEFYPMVEATCKELIGLE